MSLAGYAMITDDYTVTPYMMFLLSLTILVMGLREFQKGHKGYGWLSIGSFMIILFVSISLI